MRPGFRAIELPTLDFLRHGSLPAQLARRPHPEQDERQATRNHPLDRHPDGNLAPGAGKIRILIYPARKLPEL
jgi:hypothetical protein